MSRKSQFYNYDTSLTGVSCTNFTHFIIIFIRGGLNKKYNLIKSWTPNLMHTTTHILSCYDLFLNKKSFKFLMTRGVGGDFW